jgi:acetyltransferase-like isoleucine patch superfamily enzyme
MNFSLKDRIRPVYKILKYSYRFPVDIVYCIWKFGYWDKTWRLYGIPIIKKQRSAKLFIGKHFTACSSPYFNSLGVSQKVIIKVLNPSAKLSIGDNFGISGASISCSLNINIGNNVLIGSGTIITDSDAHPIHPEMRQIPGEVKRKPIVIEDDVFIGARSIILKGVKIGKGSVIGAGSVVSKDVPPMTIMAGNPAKVVKEIL